LIVKRVNRSHLVSLFACAGLALPLQAIAQGLPLLAQKLAAEHPSLQSLRAASAAAMHDIERAKGANGLHVGTFSEVARKTSNAAYSSAGDIGVRARYPVYDWGKGKAEISQSEARADGANARLQSETYSLWLRLAEVYINVLRQKKAVDIVQHYVDMLMQMRGQVAEIVALDKGRAIDLRQVESRLMQAQLMLSDRQNQESDANLQLRQLLNMQMVQVQSPADVGDALPKAPQVAAPRLDMHPALREAAYVVSEAEQSVRMQSALEKPMVNAQGTLNSRDAYGRLRPFSVGDVRLIAEWEAFDGGAARSATAAATERMRAATEQEGARRRDLETEIARTMTRRRDIAPRIGLWREQITVAKRLQGEFWEQFRVGRRTVLDLLSAVNDIFNAEMSESAEMYELLQADYRLYIQLGLAKEAWIDGGS
jgi:adhesin transport system outer membrane protein